MGVSPNDCQMTYFNRMFHYKPSSYWGTPIYGNPHIWKSLRIWDHHRSKGCDAIFHCRLWPPAAAYDPPVSLGHWSTSETNGLGVSSEHQINELWFLRTTLICLFIYIYILIIHTIYNIYIHTCRSCLYIYTYLPFFTYRDCVFARIYLHSDFIGSNVWIVQTSSHLRACTGGHKGTDQAEPS